MLTEDEKYRYNRHLILDNVGPEGQDKLKKARVLVIGAGGLGCPILQYLSAAGVGTIGVIDFDNVDISNLQRQILFKTEDIGKNKAERAAYNLTQLNPNIKFEVYQVRLSNQNAIELFEKYDLIIDGTDNFSTRYLVNDACVIANKPLVYGSIFKFEGQVSVFNFENGPSYRCLFPDPPKNGTVPNCSEIGVIGVLPGIIGTQQANEAIKIILGIGEPLSGKLMIYDALNSNYLKVNVSRNEKIIQSTLDMKAEFKNFDYDLFCGIDSNKTNDLTNNINSEFYLKAIDNSEFLIIDVREEYELPRLEANNLLEIPLDVLEINLEKIKQDKKIICVCQSGIRSLQAIDIFKTEGLKNDFYNLEGGVKNL